ncbi:50S ribosomal protein L36e [Xylariales sp. AK1849]|nr:50S ribosomal protein L36e [Xylariales sp. AK1849]
MRVFSTIAAILVVIAPCCAQSMPDCASTCLGTYLVQSTCNSTDYACFCANTTLLNNVETCTLGSCTIKESLAARNATNTMCGVPIRDNTMVTPIVTALSGSLAIVAVAIRLVDSRRRGLDGGDICAVMGLGCALPMGILEFVVSVDGSGKDIWAIPFDKIKRIIMFTWVTEFMYMASLGFTKIAILLFYLRIFPVDELRRICWITIGICSAYIPVFVLTTVFHCTPVSYTWTSWTGETIGTCANFNTFAWAHAIINIVLDIWIIGLPLPQIQKLQVRTRRKIHLVIMFSVGLFITIVSIVRLSSLVQFASTMNATYDNVPTSYWSVLEAFVSIICCCLPAVRALFHHVFPSCFGSTNGGSSTQPGKYRLSKNPLSSGKISKSITHEVIVSYMPRSDDSDIIELMESDGQKQVRRPEW